MRQNPIYILSVLQYTVEARRNPGWGCCRRFGPDLSGCEPNLRQKHPLPAL